MGQSLSNNKPAAGGGSEKPDVEQQLHSDDGFDSNKLFYLCQQELLPVDLVREPEADMGRSSGEPADEKPDEEQQLHAGKHLRYSKPSCEICKQEISSSYVLQEPTCPHALCSLCLHGYVQEMLQRDNSTVICPATCRVVLDPKSYQDCVPPKLLLKWRDAHQKGKEGRVEVKESILQDLQPLPQRVIARASKRSFSKALSSTSRSHPKTKKLRGETQASDATGVINELSCADADANNDCMEIHEETSNDPKGKELSSDHVFAQSSPSDGDVDEFYCNICMEPKPLAESFDVARCSHMFCRSCIAHYIATKVEENISTIGCPDPECREGLLEPELCQPILPKSVFRRWGSALCESALGTKKFYCPYKDCSALLLIDDGGHGEVITRAECPHCRRFCCGQCKVPWHEGFDCEEFQKLGEDERGREDLMLRKLAQQSQWKRCPQCMIFVDKISGCNFINCRCGHCFCYKCLSPMSKENHYCKQCTN